MMRRRWYILSGVAAVYLAAINLTNDPPFWVYQGRHQLWAATGLHMLSPTCTYWEHDELGSVSVGLPVDECYRMTEPRRYHGVWLDQFEGSRFLPGGTEVTPARLDEPRIWLNVERNQAPGLLRDRADHEFYAWEVEFVGRRTLFPGNHGHMGGSEHEIVVDRMISARALEPEPWRAAVDAYWERRLALPD